jgi:hypothetical protein
MFASYYGQSRPSEPIKSRRKVFSNAMVAHVWAQQTNDDGRSSNGNFYFSGRVIYSYGSHFPIAAFVDGVTFDGKAVVLMNNERRSVSTSGHQRYVYSALNGLPVHVFNVPNVKGTHYRYADHEANLKHLVNALDAYAARLAKPHVRNWQTDQDHSTYVPLGTAEIETARLVSLGPIAQNIRNYCEVFGLDVPDMGLAAKGEAIAKAFAYYNSPVRLAKRAATAANKSARIYGAIAQAYAYLEGATDTLASLRSIPNSVSFGEHSKWLLERMQDEEFQRRNPRQSSEKRVTAAEWLDGKGGGVQYDFETTLVRRKGDTLETSQGAECPFKHAVVAFLKAQQCRATSKDWHTNGDQVRVGLFKVDAIDTLGNLKAGCHSIAFENMQALAMREVPHLVKACFPLPALTSWVR